MTTRGVEWDRVMVWFSLAAVRPLPHASPDTVRWKFDTKRCFSVSSAYKIRMHINSGSAVAPWNGRLLSNKERARCHLTSDTSCLLGGAAREGGSHLLRECPLVEGVVEGADKARTETTAIEGITPRSIRMKEKMIRALQKRVVRQRVQERTVVGEISWEAPPNDWVKLNTDGGWWSDSGWATCGGVLRNSDAEWILGF
ncbi:uncharacterized protein LOC120142873 [Hibiscus syriacus]|uniref:uncharacterized protein LOC120142873 n=1 Tax=Hibiscus syriacus TaxID=106335 RepID=UPI00192099A9|nr:uncharacterized protein LOC120142873 [Hibiscus syriacus]